MIRLLLIPAVLLTSGCLLDRELPRTQTAPVVRCHPQDNDCRQYQQEQRRIQQARQNEARVRNRTINRATENIVRRSCMEAFRGSGSYGAMGMCGDGTQFGSAVLGSGL